MRKIPVLATLILVACGSGICLAWGQSGNNNQISTNDAVAPASLAYASSSADSSLATSSAAVPAYNSTRPFSTVGVEAKISLLGAGLEAATPLSMHTNLRVGFNTLSYDSNFSSDGVDYDGAATLRSFDAVFDWFPFRGGFHVSPGALLYNGNQLKANASVPGNQSFSLNGSSYVSDPAVPVTGTGTLKFNRAAPMLLMGWGNIVPRTKRFSMPFEVGAAFQGTPKAALSLTGDVCDSSEKICLPISADPDAQSDIQGQEAKLESDVKDFKYYPVLSLGFSYKF